jgi:hypothetical protein
MPWKLGNGLACCFGFGNLALLILLFGDCIGGILSHPSTRDKDGCK